MTHCPTVIVVFRVPERIVKNMSASWCSWASDVDAQLSDFGRRQSADNQELTSSLRSQKEYVAILEARLSEAEEQLTWIKPTLRGPFTYQATSRPRKEAKRNDAALPARVDLSPSSSNSSRGISPEIVALHGGFSNPCDL